MPPVRRKPRRPRAGAVSPPAPPFLSCIRRSGLQRFAYRSDAPRAPVQKSRRIYSGHACPPPLRRGMHRTPFFSPVLRADIGPVRKTNARLRSGQGAPLETISPPRSTNNAFALSHAASERCPAAPPSECAPRSSAKLRKRSCRRKQTPRVPPPRDDGGCFRNKKAPLFSVRKKGGACPIVGQGEQAAIRPSPP